MAEATVLGLTIELAEDDQLRTAQPLDAVVMVKALNSNGLIVYLECATPGLTTVEAYGMLGKAALKLERQLASE